MQPFDFISKGSRKPISWENGKPLPYRSHAGSSFLLVLARPSILWRFAPSRPVHSHYGSSTNPNPPPKSMASQISMIGGEYKVRTITGDEFNVIYTRSSAMAVPISDDLLPPPLICGSSPIIYSGVFSGSSQYPSSMGSSGGSTLGLDFSKCRAFSDEVFKSSGTRFILWGVEGLLF